MSSNRSLAAAAIASLVGLSVAAAAGAEEGKRPPKEKCYGIAKKAQNDCASASHSCSNEAKTDGDKGEWVWLPKGTCEKIVGGSLEAGK